MGQRRSGQIEEFQRRAGITPAKGHYAERLNRMQEEAVQLIEVIVLEKAGIRDGDGYWSGCDPLGEIIHNLSELNSPKRDTTDVDESESPFLAEESEGEPF